MKDFEITKYEPKNIIKHFSEICKIPHISSHEKQLSDYLKDFFKKNGCQVKQNEIGNLIAIKPATKGYENYPSILLQAHIDMVPSVASNCEIDMTKEPVKPYIENGWMKAENTSLGADDGWGVAFIMEIVSNNDIKHGPIEILLTVQEETTVAGARSIVKDSLKSKYYINLDNGNENLINGSAGARSFIACRKFKLVNTVKINKTICKFRIFNLKGGHSALNIVNDHINAIKFVGDVLYSFSLELPINLIKIDGGSSKAAIPTLCEAIILINSSDFDKLNKIANEHLNAYKKVALNDKNAEIELTKIDDECLKMLSIKDTEDVLGLVATTFNGVALRDKKNCSSMFLSSNLGIIKTNNNEIMIRNMARSFNDSLLKKLENSNKLLCKKFKFNKIIQTEEDLSSSWDSDLKENDIAKFYSKLYKKNTRKNIKTSKTPGLLEIAYVLKKNPDMAANSICIGVKQVDYHSYSEKVELASLEQIFKVLVELLKTANTLSK